jgi:hypothetical protein
MPAGATEDERAARLWEAAATLQGIGPQNELEGMLAAQMVATHNAAMEHLKEATRVNQPTEAKEMSLKYATKLLALYAKQVETFYSNRIREIQIRHSPPR